ncbi:MAG: hypothetical protein U0105_04985 [Candidatus Obscuribacterales bacterium]|jgi:adenosyl cobinamide kinase/adenosyl cobinamide phosphate guanylyltransferase
MSSDGQVIVEGAKSGKSAHLEAFHEEVGKEMTGGAAAGANYEFNWKTAMTPADIDENYWRAAYASMSTEDLLKAADDMGGHLSGMANWSGKATTEAEKIRQLAQKALTA